MADVDDILAEILRLRGAEYVCLADRVNGRVVSEAGHDDSVTIPGVVVKLDQMVSGVLGSETDDELEDLMISSRYRYHLIRHVDSSGAPPLLLYLRLQRSRANLAVARRELASTELNDRLVGVLRSPDGRARDHGPPSLPGRTHRPGQPQQGDESSLDAVLPPLPRRAPTSSRAGRAGRNREPELKPERKLTPEPELAPDDLVTLPTVLRQSWAFDRKTMERLVHGLRRKMP